MEDEVVYKLVGDRISSALDISGKLQKELAQELGVTDNTVCYWCSGARHPNIPQLIRISEFLGVSTDYLLGVSDCASLDENIQNACRVTGLTEDAVCMLQRLEEERNYFVPLILSSIIVDEGFERYSAYLQLTVLYSNRLKSRLRLQKVGEGIPMRLSAEAYADLRLARFETVELFGEILKRICDYEELSKEYRTREEIIKESVRRLFADPE